MRKRGVVIGVLFIFIFFTLHAAASDFVRELYPDSDLDGWWGDTKVLLSGDAGTTYGDHGALYVYSGANVAGASHAWSTLYFIYDARFSGPVTIESEITYTGSGFALGTGWSEVNTLLKVVPGDQEPQKDNVERNIDVLIPKADIVKPFKDFTIEYFKYLLGSQHAKSHVISRDYFFEKDHPYHIYVGLDSVSTGFLGSAGNKIPGYVKYVRITEHNAPPLPNLKAGPISLSDNYPRPGFPDSLYINIENDGAMEPQSFDVDVYANDILLTRLGKSQFSSDIPNHWYYEYQWTPAVEGEYTFKVVVDPEDKLIENIEKDNIAEPCYASVGKGLAPLGKITPDSTAVDFNTIFRFTTGEEAEKCEISFWKPDGEAVGPFEMDHAEPYYDTSFWHVFGPDVPGNWSMQVYIVYNDVLNITQISPIQSLNVTFAPLGEIQPSDAIFMNETYVYLDDVPYQTFWPPAPESCELALWDPGISPDDPPSSIIRMRYSSVDHRWGCLITPNRTGEWHMQVTARYGDTVTQKSSLATLSVVLPSVSPITPTEAAHNTQTNFRVTAPGASACRLNVWKPDGTSYGSLTMAGSGTGVWSSSLTPVITGVWHMQAVAGYPDGSTQKGPDTAISVIPLPDLIIDSISYSPMKENLGKQIDVSVVVKNTGSSSSNNGVVFAVFNDRELGTHPVNALTPGSTETVHFIIQSDKAGSYQLMAITDYSKTTVESDETNNRNKVNITISTMFGTYTITQTPTGYGTINLPAPTRNPLS